MAQHGEASVEEILESIKKVIARDNRDGALQARRKRALEAEAADDDRTPAADEVLDLAEMEFVAEGEAMSDAEDSAAEDTPLTNEEARGAMRDNLAALAMLAEPGAPPQIVRSGETSLEGLTRDLLRPMLAEWLDKNMPGIVEKLVQAEIARIAGKRG